ncbi:MAG TPA: foldase, partial [Myxococcota bacterium]|nr:foldase [Myxococcota bacterium]
GVVATSYGYHLFKLVERHPAKDLSLAEVRGQVEGMLRRAKEWEAEQEYVAGLRKGATVTVKENRLADVM